jgi:hypothetical protein
MSEVAATIAVMTFDEERARRGRTLLDAMRQGYGNQFPMHVLWRMAAFVADDEIVYADAHIQAGEGRTATGVAVAFTANRVVQATFTDAPVEETEKGTSTATCSVWSRRHLQSVATAESAEGSPDWAWYHQWAASVPSYGRLHLAYAQGQALTLPLDPGHRDGERLSPLLGGLLEDLSAAS